MTRGKRLNSYEFAPAMVPKDEPGINPPDYQKPRQLVSDAQMNRLYKGRKYGSARK